MPPAGQRKVEASSGVSGPPDEGETEPIAEDSLFSPSPVSCADILPRWGGGTEPCGGFGAFTNLPHYFLYSDLFAAGRGQAAALTQKPQVCP